MKIIVMLICLIFASNSFAYKISIFTDQADHSKAQQVIDTFQSTYPFNQFQIEYEIVDITTKDLGCKRDPNITRLILCEKSVVSGRAAERGSDQAMIVWNDGEWGGSGGSVPAITRVMPPRVMLHEYLHNFNFSDEYEYEASEAARYCRHVCNKGSAKSIKEAREAAANATPPQSVEEDPVVICEGKQVSSTLEPNLAYIHPFRLYTDDQQARSRHRYAIAWSSRLGATPITNTNGTKLGTGSISGQAVLNTNGATSGEAHFGLYRGATCDKADPPLPTYSPSSTWTVMRSNAYGLGPEYEQIVESMLDSRAIPRKSQSHANGSSTTTPSNGKTISQ